MSTKQNKKEFYGSCLPQRKRHYFGRNTGWAGGMGQPWIHKCVWCGKYNPKWEPKFWEEEVVIKIPPKKKYKVKLKIRKILKPKPRIIKPGR